MRFLPLLLVLGCPTKEGDDSGGADDTAEDTADVTGDAVAECATTEPCGGDAVGSWTVADLCVTDSRAPLDDCPEGYSEVTDASMTGAIELAADGTYLATFTSFSMEVLVHMPASCLSGFDCVALSEAAEMDCADAADGDGCDCTNAISDDGGDPDSGTWSASGTTLTLQSEDGEPSEAEYCADADELWIAMPTEPGQPTMSMLLSK